VTPISTNKYFNYAEVVFTGSKKDCLNFVQVQIIQDKHDREVKK
jgi:hypothetical protein